LFVCFVLFAVLELELRAFTLSHSTSPFCDSYFQDRVSQTTCLGWLRTSILLISASWVARITGMSHWCPALFVCLKQVLAILPRLLLSSWAQVMLLPHSPK
jgi:hypothetical protein